MALPNYPNKYDAASVTEPQSDAAPLADLGYDRDAPEAAILCYQPSLFEHVGEAHAAETLSEAYHLCDVHVIEGTDGAVVTLGNFGIGAPTAVALMEELIAAGVERFCSIGTAGCLQSGIEMGDVIVADRAIRDEGTSYHYLDPNSHVGASASLMDALAGAAGAAGKTVHRGTTWTIDAPYRETGAEIEHYAEQGVLTVEMEAAATFAVAEYRGVEAGAAFVISDYLGPDEWDPRFDETDESLQDLFAVAVDALTGRGNPDGTE